MLLLVALAAPLAGSAEDSGRMPGIGYLTEQLDPSAFDEAFVQGLRTLGYVEGTSIMIEYRWAGTGAERRAATS